MSQIFRICSSIGWPSFAMSEGFVVTPSTTPHSTPRRSSSRLAVSRKIFTFLSLNHGIAEQAYARNFHLHRLTWPHRSDSGRGTCCNQIAGLERHASSNERDYSIDRKDHVRNRTVLLHFTVEPRNHAQF